MEDLASSWIRVTMTSWLSLKKGRGLENDLPGQMFAAVLSIADGVTPQFSSLTTYQRHRSFRQRGDSLEVLFENAIWVAEDLGISS